VQIRTEPFAATNVSAAARSENKRPLSSGCRDLEPSWRKSIACRQPYLPRALQGPRSRSAMFRVRVWSNLNVLAVSQARYCSVRRARYDLYAWARPSPCSPAKKQA
jgi:hypothetical protein